MRRFIFLDFDGVMDTPSHTERLCHDGLPETDEYGVLFAPECIANLKKIIDSTGAEIVVTSSWKYVMGYERILRMWKDRALPGFVMDMTPTCSNHRGDEIAAWLKIFEETAGGEEYEYVIVDDLDESNFNEDQISHLVTVDPFHGLDQEACWKVLHCLS